MELKDFLINIFPHRIEDIVVHYNGQKYSIDSEPSISDMLEDLTMDAELSRDVDIILEIPSKSLMFRRVITFSEVSPLVLPQEERPEMPNIRIDFDPVTFAPEQIVLQDQFALPIVRWKTLSIQIPNEWAPIDSSYGVPFGSYKLEIALPKLPEFKKKTAEILVTLSPDLNLGLSVIESGDFSRDYSRYSLSIEEIDPEAFKIFQLIKKRVKDDQTKKIEALLENEWTEYEKTGSFDEPDYTSIFPKAHEEEVQFQVSRNMAGYRYMYFIENSIRSFVWGKLQTIYADQAKASPKWWMGCLPEAVRSNIKEKMSTKNPILDQLKGETIPLHYCSFNELGQIIEKEWQKVFRERPLDRNAFFGHMSYLEHIRNAIAHTRPLGHQELAILYSNGNSALKMLGIEIPKTIYANILGAFGV